MKKLAILTSLLALTACGGGSGGGSSVALWTDDTVITREMLNNSNTVQSQETQKKLETIKYVEDNLGSLIEDNELTGRTVVRSATNNKFSNAGMSLQEIEARYQEALLYFNILKDVMNADKDSEASKQINNRDVKIAYCLSTGKSYDDESTKQEISDHFGISVSEEDNTKTVDINLLVVTIKVTITENCENNTELKETVTEEITEEIPVLKPEQEPENQPSDTPVSVDETKFQNIKYGFSTGIEDLSFNVENGKIKSMNIAETMLGDFKRQGDTSVYSDTGYSFFVPVTFNVYFTLLDENPKNSPEALEKLKQQLQSDINNHNCYADCVTYTKNMIENNTYTVTSDNGSYKIEFPVVTEWGDLFMTEAFFKNNIENNIKGQQLYYLSSTGQISEERANEIRNDSSIKNVLEIDGICDGYDNDCESVLQSMADGKAKWAKTTLSFDMNIEDDPELSYASFGHTVINSQSEDASNNHTMKELFAGGDQTKRIDIEQITTDASFKGKAIGLARLYNEREDEETVSDLFTTNNATLTVNASDRKETLYMPFAKDGNKYYDVTVETGASGPKFTFENGENVEDAYKIPSLNGTAATYSVPDQNNPGNYIVEEEPADVEVHTGYYGNNGEVSEVSGTAYYEEMKNDGNYVEFESAFGMKKVQ